MSKFDVSFPEFQRNEGGYVNHPDDPGGPTNKGVTLANFRKYVKPNGTVEDLKKISNDQVKTVFRVQYWDKSRGEELPWGVGHVVGDFGINSGPSRANKHLQAAVGVTQDGVIGPATLAAVSAANPLEVIKKVSESRRKFVRGLKNYPSFKNGWERRIDEAEAFATSLVKESSTEQKVTENIFVKILLAILRLFIRSV